MNALWSLIHLLVFIQIVTCRDFYLGMFRRNDFLVAQDVIYKAPAPFGSTTANYGRVFKCPITYFRVVDRLGMRRGPITTIVRGGLKKKFIAVRIKSAYRLPISVNIYVGCENKKPSTFRTTKTTTTLTSTHATTEEPESDYDDEDTDADADADDTSVETTEAATPDGSDIVATTITGAEDTTIAEDTTTAEDTTNIDVPTAEPSDDNSTDTTTAAAPDSTTVVVD